MSKAKKTLSKQALVIFTTLLLRFAPPEKILPSEFAQEYRVLSSSESARPGKWRNERTPHAVEIMDCAADRSVKEVFVMSSAQMAKSEIINNLIAFRSKQRPSSAMLVQPTVKLGEDYSKDRIEPMIRNSPVLKNYFYDKKHGSTTLHKKYPGGHLTIVGSNSPASLASRPIRDLYIDELDRCSITKEGDSVVLAEKRTTTFGADSLKFKVSTPTIKNRSRIERGYNRSDKRKRFIKCPSCNHEQVMKWEYVKWKKRKVDGEIEHLTDTAAYHCSKCGYAMRDRERFEVLRKAVWKATAPFKGVAGFQISELYTLARRLKDIVDDFIKWKDNPETLRVFVNTVLGETFELRGIAPDWETLFRRREEYPIGEVQEGVCFLTCGVDVQGDRIEGEVVGWGRNLETWSVNRFILHGNPANPQDKCWKALDKEVMKTYPDAKGNRRGLSKVAIDANYLTKIVHKWVKKWNTKKVVAVVGSDSQALIVGAPKKVDLKKDKVAGLKSYPVGVSNVKEEFYCFLGQKPPLEFTEKELEEYKDEGVEPGYPVGYCHFPQYGVEYFKQLCSEKQVYEENRRGFSELKWIKTRDRNEALDIRVYNRAAASLVGIDSFDTEDFDRKEAEYIPGIIVQPKQEPIRLDRKKSKFWS